MKSRTERAAECARIVHRLQMSAKAYAARSEEYELAQLCERAEQFTAWLDAMAKARDKKAK